MSIGEKSGAASAGLLAALAVWLVVPAAGPARGDRVVLRIRAANPAGEPQRVEIRSNLPARVDTNSILATDGLQVGYDIKTDRYFMHGEIDLGPREIRVFDVALKDIWNIDAGQLDALEAHIRELTGKLARGPYAETATELQADMLANLERIRVLQREFALGPGVRPVQHIRAYEENLGTLRRVKIDVGHLENLVLGSGQDTGVLIGEAEPAAKPMPAPRPPEDYASAVIRIVVRNTSPQETRRVRIERDLPPEITLQDVLDAGELEVGTRPGTGVTYVFRHGIEIPPGESMVYDVTIRDPWNLTAPRVRDLRARADVILEQVTATQRFGAIEAALRAAIGDLDALDAARGPETVDDAYVAFYRRQGEELDGIERTLARIEAAMRPIDKTTRYGFSAKAPSMKTTWAIIYGILGFLALLSLAFFLRWYGGTGGK